MLKKFILISLNFLLITACFSCNKSSETNIKIKLKPPENGWKIVQGEKIALALPENFEGGNPPRELKLLTAKLKSLDCVSQQTTEKLEQNANSLSLIAFLPQCESGHLVTSINVISHKVKSEISLDQYLTNEVNKLRENTNIIQREIIEQNQQLIGKIITETKLEQTTLKQLFYIVPNSQNYWIITYSSSMDKFAENLPIFENSFKTLQFL